MNKVFHTEIFESDSEKEAVLKSVGIGRTWLANNPEHEDSHIFFDVRLRPTKNGPVVGVVRIGKKPGRTAEAFRSIFTLESLLSLIVVLILSGIAQYFLL